MIYVIVLTFQYLAGFSDIRLSSIEEHQELSYINNVKDGFIQTLNTSNISNNGDMNKMVKDIDFTKNFFKQELLKKGIDFDSKFIFFSNGFESDDLSDWTSVYGTPQLVNYTAYDGVNSLYSNSVEYVTKNLSGVSEVYVRAYVNFGTMPLDPNIYYFINLYENGIQFLGLGLWNNNGVYKVLAYSNVYNYAWVSSGISINNNEWHYFELYWLENSTNSTIEAWYDGQLEINNHTIDSSGHGKLINQYNFGGVNIGGGGTPDLYVDCIAVSSDYVGAKCYPDSQNYFDFSMKTNEMETTTEFPYQEKIIPKLLWFNPYRNNTLVGQPTLFNLNWTDNMGLSGYVFSFDNCTGSFVNDAWVPMTGLSNLSSAVKTISSVVGCTIRWQVYANDTYGKWNTSQIFSFPTTGLSPQYWLNFVNNTIAGQPTLFSLNWTDDTGLSGYKFSTNNTGTWVNDTWKDFENQSGNAIFIDGFESGDFSKWTDTYPSSPSVQSIVKHIGSYAMETTANAQGVEKAIGLPSDVYARFYYNYHTSLAGTNYNYIMKFTDITRNNALWVGVDEASGGSIRIRVTDGSTFSDIDAITVFVPDTWYSIEVRLLSAVGGRYELYVNGNLELSRNFDSHLITNYYLYLYESSPISVEEYFDDVVVSTSYIGPYSSWSNVTKTLNSTSGSNVQWCVYANDTSNYWNSTSCINPFSLTTSGGNDNVLNINFNEANGTIAHDSSTYHNDGVYYGETFNDGSLGNGACDPGSGVCPSRFSGYFGSALNFNGNNQYVSIPDSNSLDGTGMNNFTLEAWINISLFQASYQRVVHKNNAYHMYIDSANRKVVCGHYGGSWQTVPIASTLNLNTWYHVACVYNHSRLSIYLNGFYEASISKSDDTPNSADPIIIGLDEDLSTYDFNGTIDEVRIYNRSLSQSEIQAEMNSPLPITRPVADWSFEEPSIARYVNDTHIWVNGTYGSAISFDGSNDYVQVPSNSLFQGDNMKTIEAWVKPSSMSVIQLILEKGDTNLGGAERGPYFLAICNDGKVVVDVYDTTATMNGFGSSSVLSANNWYHLALVINTTDPVAANEVKLYINGTQETRSNSGCQANAANDLGAIRSNTQPVFIGIRDTSGIKSLPFNGTIDEVRIWNRSLSQAEIQAEMSKG